MKKKLVLMTSALMTITLLAGCNKHTHEWGDVSYTWAEDNSTCTATRVCLDNEKHIETETVNSSYKVVEEAKCEEPGRGRYTADFTSEAFIDQTKDVTIESKGHKWGNPSYVWSDDNTKCTATAICENDSTHKLEETVDCKYDVVEAATEEADGKGKYTATFTKKEFTTQEKEVVIESLPTLSKLTFTSNGDGTYSVKCKDRYITGIVKIPSTYGDGEEEGAVTTLPEQAFFGAGTFTEVFIPSSIKTIGTDGFYKCEKMTDVHFAENSVLESLGNYVFQRCHSLVSVTLPKSVKTLGEQVFDELDNLESVVFEEGNELESIGGMCFSQCPKLKTIKFAETVKFKELDYNTFRELTALEELDLPNSVESIASYGIRECSSLKTLWLSKGLKTLQSYSIDTCPIEYLHFKGTVEEWNQIDKKNNWCYTVSTNVVHCTNGDVNIK